MKSLKTLTNMKFRFLEIQILKVFIIQNSSLEEDFLKIKENNFIGYGPMGDRYIINNTASSIIFYSLSSGGILFDNDNIIMFKIALSNFIFYIKKNVSVEIIMN